MSKQPGSLGNQSKIKSNIVLNNRDSHLQAQKTNRFADKTLYLQTRDMPVERAHSLLPELYHNDEAFKLEQEKIFKKTWVCAGYLDEFQNPGDCKAINIGGQSIILIRNKFGIINGFHNCCRHRGSQLLEEGTKDNKKVIACPYHCWTYSHEGQLLGTSLFNKARIQEKLAKEQHKEYSLLPVNVDHWGPFVFVNLDKNCISLQEYLGDIPEKYANYTRNINWKLLRQKKYTIRSNWKNINENFNDWYHIPWIHPGLAPVSTVSNHALCQGPGMYTGFKTFPLTPDGTPADYQFLPAVSALNTDEAQTANFMTIFPNISLFMLPHHIFTLVLYPKEAGLCYEFGDLLVAEETVEHLTQNNEEHKFDEIMSFWDEVNVEDIKACEMVQSGQKAQSYTGGPFSQFETCIHRFQKMVIECITAKGQPNYSHFMDKKIAEDCNMFNDFIKPSKKGDNFI